MIAPDQLFDRPAAALPERAGLPLMAAALVPWLLALAAIVTGHGWVGAGLCLLAWVWLGLADALARRRGLASAPPLGLLLPAFGFALAVPERALAAMFLLFGLAVWAMLGRAAQGWTALLVTLAYIGGLVAPSCFSLFAYLIGIACFVLAGQGSLRR